MISHSTLQTDGPRVESGQIACIHIAESGGKDSRGRGPQPRAEYRRRFFLNNLSISLRENSIATTEWCIVNLRIFIRLCFARLVSYLLRTRWPPPEATWIGRVHKHCMTLAFEERPYTNVPGLLAGAIVFPRAACIEGSVSSGDVCLRKLESFLS